MDRRRPALLASAALAAAALVALAVPTAAWADPPQALPQNAPQSDLAVQPATDYDTDGCYPTPAIGPDGTPAEGLNTSGALNGNCHDASDLANANSYVRTKCNAGWCGHLYAYYFEKDQIADGIGGGHRHDLEHVVVWTRDGDAHPQYVSASAHGDYDTRAAADIVFQGDHPEIVYHKDGAGTHAFRFAKTDGGDEPPENARRTWQYPALVGWDGYPSGVREVFVTHDYGSAQLDIKDERFADSLAKAKPDGIPFDPYA